MVTILLVAITACTGLLEIDRIRADANNKLSSAYIENVPFFAQNEFQCGPAALSMMLNWSGVTVSPDQLVPLVYVPERRGSFQVELKAAARQFERIPYVIAPSIQALLLALESGYPVLVFQNLGLSWAPRWHYAVATGFDVTSNVMQLHTGTMQDYKMDLDTFERTWLRTGKWAMLVLRPGEIPHSASPLQYLIEINKLENNKRIQASQLAYEAAVEYWPENMTVRMAIANFFFAQENFKMAKQHYREAIRINTDYAPAHNNYAQLLVKLNELKLAREHAHIAVTIGGKYRKRYIETLHTIENAIVLTKSPQR